MSGIDTYRAVERETADPRAQERRLLRRVNKALAQARDEAEADDGRITPALASALNDNRSLWRQLAADLADEENQLPDELRAGLISIAGFVERRTSDVLSRRMAVAEGVPGLLEVNESIARGLES